MTADAGYAEWLASFRWRVPKAFNLATAILDRQPPDRLALIDARDDAPTRRFTFGELDIWSNRFANVLFERGIVPQDRVAILMPPRAEVAVAHFAIGKTGTIALPLFAGYGVEALRFRLKDASARLVIADREGSERARALQADLPELEHVIDVDSAAHAGEIERAEPWCAHEPTHAEDPALILYTSGTTGAPRGAVHAQRVLLGHLPGVEMAHHPFPQAGDRFWTPVDWAWIGGLLDVVLPSLFHGVPIVAGPGGTFDSDRVAAFLAEHEIKNVFAPPTPLRLMRSAGPDLGGVALRTIACGGEPLGEDVVAWVKQAFGCAINEVYGQTEANLLVAGMATSFPRAPGAIGRAVPGHTIAIVDPQGHVLPWNEPGLIAVHRPDPVIFLGYWNQPEATQARFLGDWLVTGDVGRMDPDGYVTFIGRDDDLMTAGGHRIGPAELEAVLGAHPDVAQVAVVGVPEADRGEAVVACVVLREGAEGTDALVRALQTRASDALGRHAVPRDVVFRQSLPLTATGSVLRRDLRAMLAVDRGA